MNVTIKDPGASLDYRFDWAGSYLESGETIISSSFSMSPIEAGGLAITATNFDTSASWAIVTGGIVHHTYTLTCTIETDQGRLDERSMVLRVQER